MLTFFVVMMTSASIINKVINKYIVIFQGTYAIYDNK